MYDHPSYHSGKKQSYYNDETQYLPTAEKTNFKDYSEDYIERTPKKMDLMSPSKSNRLSDAKRSIDEAIQLVSNKKSLNEEAISEVRHVNNQILGSLSSFNPIKANLQQNRDRTAEQYRSDDSRDYVATSQFEQFEWKPLHNSNRNQENVIKNQRSSVSNSGNENFDVRTRLNEEIKKNNELYRYVTALESENSQLKASRAQPSTNQSGNINQLIEQNKILKSRLAMVSSQVNNGYNQQVPIDILQELQRLKEQNHKLRQDTIHLLKSTKN